MSKTYPPSIYRVIDANLNRIREGIRVCEDIQRYIYNDKKSTKKLKFLRHKCRVNKDKNLLKTRDVNKDVSKKSTKSEKKRENLKSIQISNIKRSQESARVLEEVFKLIDTKISNKFKKIRYELYDIEKNILL